MAKNKIIKIIFGNFLFLFWIGIEIGSACFGASCGAEGILFNASGLFVISINLFLWQCLYHFLVSFNRII